MWTRATVVGLTSSAAPMAASVQPGPASPWLALSRIRAWVRALAGATPRPIMVCSRARSCSDRTTTYRLRTSASCGGIPGRTSMRPNPRISQITTDDLLARPGGAPALGEAAGLDRRPAVGHAAPPARPVAAAVQEDPAAAPGVGRAAPQAGQLGVAEQLHGPDGGAVGDQRSRLRPDRQPGRRPPGVQGQPRACGGGGPPVAQ